MNQKGRKGQNRAYIAYWKKKLGSRVELSLILKKILWKKSNLEDLGEF